MTSKFISTKKGEIHYLEGGRGKAVLLLPSMWLTSKSYEQIGGKLVKHYHVIIPDLHRGASKSLKLAKSFEDYAETLHLFIKALKIKSIHLLGFSFAGLIATWYSQKFPSSVEKMTLVSATLVSLKRPKWRFIYGYIKLFLNNMLSLKGMRINWLWLTDGFYYFLNHPRQFILDFFIATRNYHISLTKLSVPTKLLFARQDEFISLESVKFMKKIKNLDIKIINGRHAWFFFNQENLVDEINFFT